MVDYGLSLSADLRRLVEAESKTGDLPAVRSCADVLAKIGSRVLGPTARLSTIESAAGPILQWRFGEPPWRLGLVGHYDTVHATGSLAKCPYTEDGDVAHGPGVHDMKGGLLTMLYGAAMTVDTDPELLNGVVIHCCPDEEDGSRWSKPALEKMCREGLRVAAVFEGNDTGGGVVTSRKSGLWVDVTFTGHDAHGSRPEDGANALAAMAEYAAQVPGLVDTVTGTTVVPTRASSGTAMNTMPGHAVLTIDCRTVTQSEQDRVLSGLTEMRTSVPGVHKKVTVLHQFPPMAKSTSTLVYTALCKAALSAGLTVPPATIGTGVSDASHLSAAGALVIDGLGPDGGGDHSLAEWVSLSSIIKRARLTSQAIPALSALAREQVATFG